LIDAGRILLKCYQCCGIYKYYRFKNFLCNIGSEFLEGFFVYDFGHIFKYVLHQTFIVFSYRVRSVNLSSRTVTYLLGFLHWIFKVQKTMNSAWCFWSVVFHKGFSRRPDTRAWIRRIKFSGLLTSRHLVTTYIWDFSKKGTV